MQYKELWRQNSLNSDKTAPTNRAAPFVVLAPDDQSGNFWILRRISGYFGKFAVVAAAVAYSTGFGFSTGRSPAPLSISALCSLWPASRPVGDWEQFLGLRDSRTYPIWFLLVRTFKIQHCYKNLKLWRKYARLCCMVLGRSFIKYRLALLLEMYKWNTANRNLVVVPAKWCLIRYYCPLHYV